jgi:pilus assembly protein CpaC
MNAMKHAWLRWLIGTVMLLAQHSTPVAGQQVQVADTSAPVIKVPVSLSTVLTTDFDVTRIAVTNPAVADATVVQPREILVDGKAPGRISLIIWGEGKRLQYEIAVQPVESNLQQQLQMLFPNEPVQVMATDEAIFLSGKVANPDVMRRAVEIAQASSPKSHIVNLLQLPQGVSASQQVMLEVRFAEVNRKAMLELGASFFTGPNGARGWEARTSTEQFAAPNFTNRIGPPPPSNPQDEGKFTFSDFLNIFLFNNRNNLGVLIQALKTRGYFQSLAEPNLIAYNGQEASFLAGGEIPVPIAQGIAGAVTVTYKEFGVRLTFTPSISGDVIRLKVRPEVSALDFANGITLQGFRIPALTTRRAETEVELRDGQTFAIAGLLNNIAQQDQAKVPGLGDLPILGTFFKSRANSAERTELMVLVTPHLVRPLQSPGDVTLPTKPDLFLPADGALPPKP